VGFEVVEFKAVGFEGVEVDVEAPPSVRKWG
jgi:hypothetical protein